MRCNKCYTFDSIVPPLVQYVNWCYVRTTQAFFQVVGSPIFVMTLILPLHMGGAV